MPYPGTVAELTRQLRDGGYLADRGLATTLLVSLSLRRPVLLEGEAGVGKTEAVLFGPKFLLERPLLEAVRQGDRAVLRIDEVDRADGEFEAFLLEVLSDFQTSIPSSARSGPTRARSSS